jgi:hypothetical protein
VKKNIGTRLGFIAVAATPAADDDAASAQMPPDDPST